MTMKDVREAGGTIQLGPWRIDLENGSVAARDGGVSGLTSRAEALLLLMCRWPGQVVTREQIFNSVWAGRVVEEAAISNCVWQIRKALGENGKDILQTRPKRGYVLILPQSESTASSEPLLHEAAQRPQSEALAPMYASERKPETLRARWRRPALLAIVLSFFALAAVWVWVWSRDTATPSDFAVSPDADMTVSISVPEHMRWLRKSVLRAAVEEAYLRNADVVLFQRMQNRNPFAGPHLQVDVRSADEGDVVAQITLDSGRSILRRTYRGEALNLGGEIAETLRRWLPPAKRKASPATDAMVSGILATLEYDNLHALSEYRRAIARDPGMADARIAMAQLLDNLGRGREALAVLDALQADRTLTQFQRCRLNVVMISVARRAASEPLCPRAKRISALTITLDLRGLLREIDARRNQRKGAQDWLREESYAIMALARLGELELAAKRIESGRRIAALSGWLRADAELESFLSLLASYRMEVYETARLRFEVSKRLRALGDIDAALNYSNSGYRTLPLVPGPAIAARRSALSKNIALARSAGNIMNEVAALQLLLRIDRDDPVRWREHLKRIEGLVAANYSPEMQVLERHIALSEVQGLRRYQETIDGVLWIRRSGVNWQDAELWNLTLMAESSMARDDLSAAVAAVNAMEKQNFEIADTGDTCLFAWLFVETRHEQRARALLAQCMQEKYDRASQAARGDTGFVAEARLHRLQGNPELAWPVLRPRIESLLRTRDPTRAEAESLTLLARHAVGLPGADAALLKRALVRAADIAKLDGAGPGVRFGVHVLRWRLCRAEGGNNCGPVLPEWAPEDRFEARLAMEQGVISKPNLD